MASIGHDIEFWSWGGLIILNTSLVCMVFDHFRIICSPGGPKIKSALANCLRGEYEAILCGTRLEILKNVKKAII